MWLGFVIFMLLLCWILLVIIGLVLDFIRVRVVLVLFLRWIVKFLRFSKILIMFFWIFFLVLYLWRMLLIFILVIVYFGIDDSKIWCRVLFRVWLKLCFSGFKVILVWVGEMFLILINFGFRNLVIEFIMFFF